MDQKIEKSCWSVTTMALLVVGGCVAALYLFAGLDASATILP